MYIIPLIAIIQIKINKFLKMYLIKHKQIVIRNHKHMMIIVYIYVHK